MSGVDFPHGAKTVRVSRVLDPAQLILAIKVLTQCLDINGIWLAKAAGSSGAYFGALHHVRFEWRSGGDAPYCVCEVLRILIKACKI